MNKQEVEEGQIAEMTQSQRVQNREDEETRQMDVVNSSNETLQEEGEIE